MTQPLDFQSIIMALQHFWADHGCLIWQPYYTQVGAGTYNPATFLRVLGPEPWNVGYVEPSVRPDDGRYGDNPNRLQQHTQFQVILKPDPGNPQELYLQSLQTLGIDPRQHDIRFVESNWESPALGAWGLGWEVWLDGQEITQFTYFQQAGGQVLEPVSVEITYGLERIAITLQRVRHYKNLAYNQQIKFGDLFSQGEFEHSKYYFEIADVDRLSQMYALFEAEAKAALENGLVLPAYDYVLKCSHTFNVLDTRGAVGVTERQALFGRMRDLARQVSELYLAQRQRLEYPWLPEATGQPSGVTRKTVEVRPVYPERAPFLFEIGVEELPAADLMSALVQLKERIPALLDELHLTHGDIKVLGTPRRLVIVVNDLASQQPERVNLFKGPPADRAYDTLGVPTKAAEGFARSRGVPVDSLEVREMDGGRYVVANVKETGRPAVVVLSEVLPGLITALRFDKSMRWNSSGVSFSRPIRWLLALFGDQPLVFEYAGLVSGTTTRGLRFREPAEITVTGLDEYFKTLALQGIILDSDQRRSIIRQQVTELMHRAGGDEMIDEVLLDEVTQLVEAPTALAGSFEQDHLQLPPEVLVSVMKKHQRYFPVTLGDLLLPYFIAVRNGDDQHLDVVADGNEQVIRARFSDAAFFIREDLKHSLEDFLPRLDTLLFQKKLGSMLSKSRRITRLVEPLVEKFSLDAEEAAITRRAAELCKADLVTHMVVEMTTLQGIMGRYYARHSGETAEVAQAIYEHYLPRFAGDANPTGKPGLVVGLADRLDTLAGLFAAGLAPSGTKDPFAQRRAAVGLVQSLIYWNAAFDLRNGLELAARELPLEAAPEALAACLEFIVGRLRGLLIEQGYRYDVVDAVQAAQRHNPAGVSNGVRALTAWVSRTDWNTILPAFARCVRITRDQLTRYDVDQSLLVEPAEQALLAVLHSAEAAPRQPGSVDDFFTAFIPLIPTINRFFTEIMVMVDDPRLRGTRLDLLQRIAALADGTVDLSLVEGF